MCGIAGYISTRTVEKSIINSTLNLMKNRGPDHQDSILFSSKGRDIGLLHSRLSIIDLDSRANQPYQFGDYTIIFMLYTNVAEKQF